MGRDSTGSWRGDHPWARVYDRAADSERVGGLLWRAFMGTDRGLLHRTAAAELGRLAPDSQVLDLPCGGGIVLRDHPGITRPGTALRYVAADVSPAMLERTADEARRRCVPIETSIQDVGALTFDDASFDLVLSFTSLHCFPDPQRAVAELTRVLRPGGRLALSTMLRGDPRSAHAWVGGTALGVLGPGCTRDDLLRWLETAGTTNVSVVRSGGLTYVTATRAPAAAP